MTDFPVSDLQSANSTVKITAASERVIALFRTVCGALAQATMRQIRPRTLSRTPDEILMAQTRREEARRAVDRLLR